MITSFLNVGVRELIFFSFGRECLILCHKQKKNDRIGLYCLVMLFSDWWPHFLRFIHWLIYWLIPSKKALGTISMVCKKCSSTRWRSTWSPYMQESFLAEHTHTIKRLFSTEWMNDSCRFLSTLSRRRRRQALWRGTARTAVQNVCSLPYRFKATETLRTSTRVKNNFESYMHYTTFAHGSRRCQTHQQGSPADGVLTRKSFMIWRWSIPIDDVYCDCLNP